MSVSRDRRREVLSDTELMTRFQSLGDTGEFGVVQRACGAEPLGLFRFTCSSIENITDVVETAFRHLMTREDIDVFDFDTLEQYMVRSRHYRDFEFQTHVPRETMSTERLLEREVKRYAYLKSQFLARLEEGDTIFVRKGSDTLRDLRRLHQALKRYGRNDLLIVTAADRSHPVGSVERLEDGLLRGYIESLKVCNRPDPVDLPGWVEVCRTAYRTLHPGARFERGRRLAGGRTWAVPWTSDGSQTTAIRPARSVRTAPLTSISRHAEAHVATFVRLATAGLEARQTVLVSAWVRIPEGWTGRGLELCFLDAQGLHAHPFNLARRGVWQRGWTTARLPRDANGLVAALCTSGPPVEVGRWTFEVGFLPAGEAQRWGNPPFPGRATRRERRPWAVVERFLRRNGAARRRAVADGGERSLEWFRATADGLLADGEYVALDDLLSDGIHAFPRDAPLAKLHALSAHNSGRYASAIRRWSRAVDLDADDPMCWAAFASNLREHNALDRATDVIGNALARFPHDMVVLTEAARIADATGRPADALPLWEEAIRHHGSHPEWVAARERARSRLGGGRAATAPIHGSFEHGPVRSDRPDLSLDGDAA